MEVLAERLSGGGAASDQFGALGDRGPDASEEFEPDAPAGRRRRVLQQPVVLLVLALVLLTLVAERRLLSTGGGILAGGRLLPPPGGARDLWAAYAAAWHPGSVGSATPAPPALAVLAALSTLLFGKAWLAVDVLLLGSVPLAGVTAYAAVRRVVRHEAVRLWAAATWALLPVATGAVAAGRLDAAAVQVGLPLLLLAGGRLLVEDPQQVGWRHAWATGLGLAVLVALAPTVYPVAAVLLVGGAVAALLLAPSHRRSSAPRRAAAAALTAALPLALLLPWSVSLLTEPGLLLHGPGRTVAEPALVDPALPAWHLLLLSPGGAGLPPVWLTAGLLLAALAATLRPGRRRLVVGAWAVALTGLCSALALSRLTPIAPGTGLAVPAWPGTALQVAAAGLLLAAVVGAEGVRSRLGRASFGWRQLGSGLVTVAAALVPLLALGSWLLRGADAPLHREAAAVLPAFAQAELAASPGSRVLLLQPRSDAVAYTLTDGEGVQLGAVSAARDEAQRQALDAVVADLLTPSGSDAARALATRAVRYVALPADTGGSLPLVLDAQDGLARRSRGDQILWEVTEPGAHLSLLAPALVPAALRGDRAASADLLDSSPPTALPDAPTQVAPGPAGRLLVLSEATDPGWSATLDGQELPRTTAWGWATAFQMPAQGGELVVFRGDQAHRRALLLAQGVALLVIAVLAAPGAGRRRELEFEAPSGRGRRQEYA